MFLILLIHVIEMPLDFQGFKLSKFLCYIMSQIVQ